MLDTFLFPLLPIVCTNLVYRYLMIHCMIPNLKITHIHMKNTSHLFEEVDKQLQEADRATK